MQSGLVRYMRVHCCRASTADKKAQVIDIAAEERNVETVQEYV